MSYTTPDTLGRYTLMSLISVGANTEIHKARADGVGGFRRTFALKRVRPELTGRQDLVDQLVDEARTTGLLSHANIVQIMDLGEEDGTYTVAMEYVDGVDLGRVLSECRNKDIRVPVPHAVFIGLELLKALDYAHTRTVMRGDEPQPLGMVHLGIEPSNLLLSWQGEVKLTDFGCARTLARTLTPPPPDGTTAAYASPESVSGVADVDATADLFSVGVVLYEMLTGSHPFRHDDEGATGPSLPAGRHMPADSRVPGIPTVLARTLDRALAPAPRDRFPSAAAMKESLDGFLHESGIVVGPIGASGFLKDLFPTGVVGSVSTPPAEPVRPVRTSMDADPVTHPMGDPVDADARPTTVSPPAPAPPRRPRAVLDDLSRSKAFGPLPSAADESTLVKSIDAIAAAADEWADAPTRIRAAPGVDTSTDEDLLLPDPEDDGRPTLASTAPPPLDVPAPPPQRAAPVPPPQVPAPRAMLPPAPAPVPPAAPVAPPLSSRGEPRSSARWVALGAVGAGLILGAGVLLGLEIASRTQDRQPAMLEVSGPAGLLVSVDENPFTDENRAALAAGVHTVVLTTPDGVSRKIEVSLAPGEHRVLTIQSADQ